jgi:hypothetical protein
MWIIPILLIFAFRGRSSRHRGARADRDYIAELEQHALEQQSRIEELEARVARVEDGLEFAERVLAERSLGRMEP